MELLLVFQRESLPLVSVVVLLFFYFPAFRRCMRKVTRKLYLYICRRAVAPDNCVDHLADLRRSPDDYGIAQLVPVREWKKFAPFLAAARRVVRIPRQPARLVVSAAFFLHDWDDLPQSLQRQVYGPAEVERQDGLRKLLCNAIFLQILQYVFVGFITGQSAGESVERCRRGRYERLPVFLSELRAYCFSERMIPF